MRQIHFVFFNGTSWTSRITKFFTRSKWSHVAIMPTINRPQLIEAWRSDSDQTLRWRFSSLMNHSAGTPYEVWSLPVSDDEHQYCMEAYAVYAATKTPYDMKAIWGFLLKTNRDGEGMICSEGCLRPLAEYRLLNVNPAHVSPEGLYQMLQLAGATKAREGKA